MTTPHIYYQAAGGIVLHGERLLLLRKRNKGEVVLPKGHVEDGESLEEAALRETREETGYRNFRVLAHLGTERGEFYRTETDEYVIRDETYFLLELLDDEREDAQDHDDAEYDRVIFEQLWTPLEQAPDRLTFEPARTFVRRAVEWVKTNR